MASSSHDVYCCHFTPCVYFLPSVRSLKGHFLRFHYRKQYEAQRVYVPEILTAGPIVSENNGNSQGEALELNNQTIEIEQFVETASRNVPEEGVPEIFMSIAETA